MKYILLFLTLCFSQISIAWDQWPPYPLEKCKAHVPYGFPRTTKQGTAICRAGYVTLNDTVAKLPVWVSYKLYPEYALGCVPRSNGFMADQSLPKGKRAELSDYAKSGFDIGHVAPSADMSSFDQFEKESFLLTNMVPQLAGLNRSTWKTLETSIRGWAVHRGHPLVIYAGPIYGPKDTTIGSNNVVVPHAFYKIVIDATTNEVAGFLFPHQLGLGTDLTKVRAPITKIKKLANITFTYPATATELPLNQLWPVDFGALTKAKQIKCGKAE